MTEFLENNALYTVLIIAMIIWGGIAAYLYKLDAKVTRLENSIDDE